MVDFSNVQRLKPAGDALAQVELPVETKDGAGYVLLDVLPALAVNRPFLNAQTKFSSMMSRLQSRKKEMSVTDYDKLTRAGRKQFAQHIVRGWENVYDANGDLVEFTEDVCLDFLMALPDEIFEDLHEYCRDSDNFLDLEDPEALGKP